MEQTKKRSGRPRKEDADKVEYQRIAVYKADYEKLIAATEPRDEKITDAFTKMVASYVKKS